MANTSLTPELAKLAGELAAAFASSQKVVAAKARIGLFYQNPEATDLFRKVSEYGETLRNKHMEGMPPSEEEISQFDSLRQDVIDTPICKGFLAGQYDEVHVAYTNFVSVLSQTPATLRLLPLIRTTTGREGSVSTDITYEPSSEEVFEAIIPEYLGGILYGALCESRASEQAARRTAMDSATQNADDMIADLSLKFNRARQAAITQEITEIVAGS